ncbi:MAG: protein-glutamate O-methyltransferase CheR [Acidobacteriia bacterium]|nr:protein-glutamate O-methyltransferase CheR [Terriglobia bacterium]
MSGTLGMSVRREDFDYIRMLLKEHSGVALEDGKEYLLEVRLSPLYDEMKVDSIAEMVQLLRRDNSAALRERVLNCLLTNETYFFRDIHPFEMLRTEVLPELFAARAAKRHLRIWSGACSTGQEPYSVAMIVNDLLERFPGFTVEILATDIAEENLERAMSGQYSHAEVNRGLPAQMLIRHFTKKEAVWQVNESIRRMVTFRKLNLFGSWAGIDRADLILLRNVLIYFEQDAKKEIIGRIRRNVADGGAVILGASETVLGLSEEFHIVHAGKASLYRPKAAEPVAVLSGVKR